MVSRDIGAYLYGGGGGGGMMGALDKLTIFMVVFPLLSLMPKHECLLP